MVTFDQIPPGNTVVLARQNRTLQGIAEALCRRVDALLDGTQGGADAAWLLMMAFYRIANPDWEQKLSLVKDPGIRNQWLYDLVRDSAEDGKRMLLAVEVDYLYPAPTLELLKSLFGPR